jgi:glycosyltransferase involved in cell wall biosynthesis
MKFSIITPSYRQSDWLKLCIASVADQKEVELEHIVQDACSDDGTLDWLPYDKRVRAFIEKDDGMYDAVNKGFLRAQGDILAYLNCDEQYLPGGLKAVLDFFEAHPSIEVALAGSIVIDSTGKYICHKPSLVPHPYFIWFHFPVLTSSVFIRSRVIQQRRILFNTRWRDLGDFHWMRMLLEQNVPIAVCDFFTSAFVDTGANMSLKPNAVRERAETFAMAPRWARPFAHVHHFLRRLRAGHYSLKPTAYSVYTLQSPHQRVVFDVPTPTTIWWARMSQS